MADHGRPWQTMAEHEPANIIASNSIPHEIEARAHLQAPTSLDKQELLLREISPPWLCAIRPGIHYAPVKTLKQGV